MKKGIHSSLVSFGPKGSIGDQRFNDVTIYTVGQFNNLQSTESIFIYAHFKRIYVTTKSKARMTSCLRIENPIQYFANSTKMITNTETAMLSNLN